MGGGCRSAAASTASSSSKGSFARDSALLRAAHGDAQGSLRLFSTAIETFQRGGNVAQLIVTVASIPVVLAQLGANRPAAVLHAAIAREPASLHHVPTLAELGVELAGKLSPAERSECESQGGALDLNAAAGFAHDHIEQLLETLAHRGQGDRPGGLTKRELDVLRLVADGHTTSEIAVHLFISAKTADHHIQHIYTKLGISNRVMAARWAVEHGALLH